jgi:D-glycero-alpha-D-manno-heptose-7-phosphate kinase
VLIYTGESRMSGDTITAVLGAYQSGEKRVVNALARMRALAQHMAAALERGNLDDVGRLLAEHWQFQRELHPSIPTARIDKIVERATRAGALGAKAMGASGGGCVLIIAPESGVEAIRKAVAPFGKMLEFDVDMDGVTILQKRAS